MKDRFTSRPDPQKSPRLICKCEDPVLVVETSTVLKGYDMPDPVILGLVGPSGCGKSMVCDFLRKRWGFTRIHVATPIKKGLREMFDLKADNTERPLIDEPMEKLGGARLRDIAEAVGNAVFAAAPLAIPLMLRDKLERVKRMTQPRIVVDGLRRLPEAAIVRGVGGHIVRVSGISDPRLPLDATQSEIEADFTIRGFPSATPEGLCAETDSLITTYLLPDEQPKTGESREWTRATRRSA